MFRNITIACASTVKSPNWSALSWWPLTCCFFIFTSQIADCSTGCKSDERSNIPRWIFLVLHLEALEEVQTRTLLYYQQTYPFHGISYRPQWCIRILFAPMKSHNNVDQGVIPIEGAISSYIRSILSWIKRNFEDTLIALILVSHCLNDRRQNQFFDGANNGQHSETADGIRRLRRRNP